jgi:serine/threonine protein kinase
LKTGGDLRYYLRKRYLFDERDCAFYVACISSALDHIHSKNVIHRDVKPGLCMTFIKIIFSKPVFILENIIFDERGYPYLTDFGVAHVQSDPWDKTLTCNLASGTKQYLAPEVFTKSHVHGPEVDYWSLGVVIYEVLFGRRPFDKHCPIAFIQYLEKALSLKRKYLKEMKMRELAHQSMECNSGAAGLSSPNGVLNGRSSLDFTTRASFTMTSSNNNNNQNGNNSEVNKFFNKLPGFHSPVKTAQSTDGFSTWDKDSTGLMNSANTPNTSMDHINQQQPRRLHHGISNSYQEVSPLCSSEQQTDSQSSSPNKRFSFSFSTSKANNSVNNNSGNHKEAQGKFLPELKGPSTNNTNGNISQEQQVLPQQQGPQRNKSIFKKHPSVHPSGSFIEPNNNGNISKGISLYQIDDCEAFLSQDELNRQQQQRLNEDGEVRAEPGDHWLVDEGELPGSLLVFIPQTNPWLGVMSDECLEMLDGLFDVRPSHRFGARNIDKIQHSKWLQNFQFSDWNELATKKFSPRFQPGKRFIKDTLNRLDDISQARLLGERTKTMNDNSNGGSSKKDGEQQQQGGGIGSAMELIPDDQEELFKEFFFVGRTCSNMFSQINPNTLPQQPQQQLATATQTATNRFPSVSTISSTKLNEILPTAKPASHGCGKEKHHISHSQKERALH